MTDGVTVVIPCAKLGFEQCLCTRLALSLQPARLAQKFRVARSSFLPAAGQSSVRRPLGQRANVRPDGLVTRNTAAWRRRQRETQAKYVLGPHVAIRTLQMCVQPVYTRGTCQTSRRNTLRSLSGDAVGLASSSKLLSRIPVPGKQSPGR